MLHLALARGIQKHLRSQDIRADEFISRRDASINMRFRRKVDDGPGLVAKRVEHGGSVCDVPLYKPVPPMVQPFQIVGISGVGQRVKISNRTCWLRFENQSCEG